MEIILILTAVATFGVTHTLFASYHAKLIAQNAIGKNLAAAVYRAVFNVLSILSLAPALYFVVALPDRVLYQFEGPLSYLVLAIQVVAGFGVIYSVYQLDVWFFAGFRQLLDRGAASIDSTSTSRLVTNGLHRYVRHPLYSTSIVFVWLVSPMTINRLTLIVCFTVYFYIGSIFEERKLVHEFGAAYRQYQRDVPRLIPRLR